MSNETEEKIILNFSLENCIKDHYYTISIIFQEKENEKRKFETERLLCLTGGETLLFNEKTTCNYKFEKIQNLAIRIRKESLYDKKEIIDHERLTVLSSLITSKEGKYKRPISNAYNSENIIIKLEKEKNIEQKKYLFDFLKLGVKLSNQIAFDFSKKEKTLENEIKKIERNILEKIFSTMKVYTKDNIFQLLRFGCKNDIEDKNELTKSFNEITNYLNNPEIISKEKSVLSPLLKKTINNIYYSYESYIYNVMFIFLTGDIDKNDHKEIINNIIASSYLPLSIIIICVGNHDFSKISGLFLDNKYSSEGIPKNKENVIFATIKNKYDSELIAETCLMKLRKQIIEFFQLVKSPENLKESINKISQSIVIVKNCIDEEMDKQKDFEKKEENNIINNPTPGGVYIIKNEDDKNDDKNNKKEDVSKKDDSEDEPAAPPTPTNSLNENDKKNPHSSEASNSTQASDIKQSKFTLLPDD